MRAYSENGEESRRARDLLKDWAGEGFLSPAQYQRMEQGTVCELRRTNVFLRLVLYLFTLIIIGATVALFLEVVLGGRLQTAGIFLLLFAAASYGAAEFAVSEARLYRFGIEEALVTCSVVLLCEGLREVKPSGAEFAIPAAGATLSLWIWHRFGFPYAFPAAMVFAVWLPGCWTSSRWAQHLFVGGVYAAGLGGVAAARTRHRLTYLNARYSIAEACLWLGIYLATNLQLSHSMLSGFWWYGLREANEFSRPFYWTTWVLTWCLPLAVLARGIHQKDRMVMAAGTIAAILTLATNKPYLGWPRHTWDPMLLGALLIAVALVLSRWLARGEGGVRRGFTARRLSGKDKGWIDIGLAGIGVVSSHAPGVSAQPKDPEFRFGGGDSGGGGATENF